MAGLILVGALCFCVRSLERAMTFHPAAFDASAAWTPPEGVTERWIRAADGTRLHSWWFPASGAIPPRATLLFHHGNGGNLTSVTALGLDMSRRGYQVVLWDYRGYGRSDGAPAGDEATFLADGERVMEAAVAQGRPVVVWGQSLGTTVAADLCARKTCSALVMESGLSSTYDFARTQVTWLPAWLHVFAKFSFESARKVALVKAPVLIAHGTADPVIHYEHGERLFAAAPAAGREMLRVEGAGHWLAASPGYWDQVAAFLERALAGKAASPAFSH